MTNITKKIALIGSGIKTISHLTIEAQTYIKQAECVLYLVNEPVFESWLIKYSKKCISLEKIYFSHRKRSDSYKKIANEIIKYTDEFNFISVVLYGHPTIFSSPGLEAIKIAKKLDIETIILPGISAEDCLFADLEIDPSRHGCFSVEAMSFLIFDEIVNKYCNLIIWQLGMVGNISTIFDAKYKNGIKLIKDKLLRFYSSKHSAILYEASLYPGVKPKIIEFPIEKLEKQEFSSISTLYISAEKMKEIDEIMLRKLNLTRQDLQ